MKEFIEDWGAPLVMLIIFLTIVLVLGTWAGNRDERNCKEKGGVLVNGGKDCWDLNNKNYLK